MSSPNMGLHHRDPSPTPSICSVMSDASVDLAVEEQAVRAYVKKRLSKRLFVGYYQERRFVEKLGVYRDMVVLHRSEEELKHDIMLVQAKLYKYYGFEKWIGITSPDTVGAPAGGYCLWVKLQDMAFGFYWFQIRRIRYHECEVTVHLKAVRPVKEEVIDPPKAVIDIKKTLSDNVDAFKSRIRTGIHALSNTQSSTFCGSDDTHNTKAQKSSQSDADSSSSAQPPKSFNSKFSKSGDKVNTNDSSGPDGPELEPDGSCKPNVESLKLADFLLLLQILVQNWKDVLKFFSALVVGILQGTGVCIRYVGEFSLKFIREVSLFLRSVTPIVLAVIELLGKVIGGLYILIAMLFSKGPNPNPMRQLVPLQGNRRANQYRR